MWKKNTVKCDRCNSTINKKKDKAYCFHNDDGTEVYICIPCVKEVYNDYVKYNGDGDLLGDAPD